jgi:hypothetical protein
MCVRVARQNIEPGGRNNVPGQEGGSDDEYHSAVSDERRPLLSNRGNRNYGNLEISA